MTALTVQNPCYKCDWETRMSIDKKIIAEIMIIILVYIYIYIYIYMCVCVCYNVHSSPGKSI